MPRLREVKIERSEQEVRPTHAKREKSSSSSSSADQDQSALTKKFGSSSSKKLTPSIIATLQKLNAQEDQIVAEIDNLLHDSTRHKLTAQQNRVVTEVETLLHDFEAGLDQKHRRKIVERCSNPTRFRTTKPLAESLDSLSQLYQRMHPSPSSCSSVQSPSLPQNPFLGPTSPPSSICPKPPFLNMLITMLIMFLLEGKSTQEISQQFSTQGKYFASSVIHIQGVVGASAAPLAAPWPTLSEMQAKRRICERAQVLAFILESDRMGKTAEEIEGLCVLHGYATNIFTTDKAFVRELVRIAKIHES